MWVLREIPSFSWAFPPLGGFLEEATVSQQAPLIKPYTKRAPRLAAASGNSNSMRSNGRGNCKLFEIMQIHSLNNSHELSHMKVEKKTWQLCISFLHQSHTVLAAAVPFHPQIFLFLLSMFQPPLSTPSPGTGTSRVLIPSGNTFPSFPSFFFCSLP